MFETVKLWLPSEQKTQLAGKSLAHTLYTFPITIFLRGDLGAGKTTFLQGFAKELGIEGVVTSPTYALEQQYRTRKGLPFIHIDLYRLSMADAAQLLDQTDIQEGIRCVEWADRLPEIPAGLPHILIDLKEENDGRTLTVGFHDVDIPDDATIHEWRMRVHTRPNIDAHCDTVAHVSGLLADQLLQKGNIVRTNALTQASLLHDLLRFVDFKPHAAPPGLPPDPAEDIAVWDVVKKDFPGMKHEEAAAAFLRQQGYPVIGDIVSMHGLTNDSIQTAMLEQQLLYYADKRVAHDTIVSLQERMQDFERRYGKSPGPWAEQAMVVEQRLFPDGPPPLS